MNAQQKRYLSRTKAIVLHIHSRHLSMKLYRSLSRIPLLKKYTAKFMFVAFLGIHIPLFGVIGVLIASSGTTVNKIAIFLLTLGLTLLATTITLFILNALVEPLKETQQSLSNYLKTKTMPGLPQDMTDEMGLLMRDVSTVVNVLHNSIDEKDRLIKTLSTDLKMPAINIQALIKQARQANNLSEADTYLAGIETAISQQLKLMDEITANQK